MRFLAVVASALALHVCAGASDVDAAGSVEAVEAVDVARHVDPAPAADIDVADVLAVEHAMPVSYDTLPAEAVQPVPYVSCDTIQAEAVQPVPAVPPAAWYDRVEADEGSRAYWVLVSARERAVRGEDVSWLRVVFADTLARWMAKE